MKKVNLYLLLQALYTLSSFAGPGSSKPLEEGEPLPTRRSVVSTFPNKWDPSLENGFVLKGVIVFLEFPEVLQLERVSSKIRKNKRLWRNYLKNQGVDWYRETDLWKKLIVCQIRMREIAHKEPLRLGLKDKCLVDIAKELNHPIAMHIITQYYPSSSSGQSLSTNSYISHSSLEKFMNARMGYR